MSTDQLLKTEVIRLLSESGYVAKAITESDRNRTPDIFACRNGERLHLELKRRIGARQENGSDVEQKTLGRTNKTSSILEDATEQLTAVHSPEALNLLWFFVPEEERCLYYEQIRATAYGVRIAVGGGALKDCYYSTFCDFYRYRKTLDGIALGRFGALLLNEFSAHYQLLRDSYFRTLFGEAVCDPLELEEHEEIFVIRGEVDRRDTIALQAYLLDQYEVDIVHFTNLIELSA